MWVEINKPVRPVYVKPISVRIQAEVMAPMMMTHSPLRPIQDRMLGWRRVAAEDRWIEAAGSFS